jgi:hypothetical protein
VITLPLDSGVRIVEVSWVDVANRPPFLSLQLEDSRIGGAYVEHRLTEAGADAGLRVVSTVPGSGSALRVFSNEAAQLLVVPPNGGSPQAGLVFVAPNQDAGPARSLLTAARNPDQFAAGFIPNGNEWVLLTGNGTSVGYERWSRTETPVGGGDAGAITNFIAPHVMPWAPPGLIAMAPGQIVQVGFSGVNATHPLPGLVPQGVATGDAGIMGVVARNLTTGALSLTRVLEPSLLPQGTTTISPSRAFTSPVVFDGSAWRIAFEDRPTKQLWLATVTLDGALVRLQPVTCDARRYEAPTLAAPTPSTVFITFSNEVETGLLRVQ